MVRHQPSKLTFRGFESHLPLNGSVSSARSQVSHDTLALDTGHFNHGLVAQRLAQATHNRLVASSNLAGPTKK